jgi:hypothetical protein
VTSEWTRVKWSEARQITRLLAWEPSPGDPDGSALPQLYFEALRAAGRGVDAADFLGQALPRWETVAWAARAVRDLTDATAGKPANAAALKAALLWVQDPTESRRRAAFEAAEAAPATSAERFAALAAFFSGGSIAPADCDPLPAARDAAGRFAAGAVLLAAFSATDPASALGHCLDSGAALASTAADGAA